MRPPRIIIEYNCTRRYVERESAKSEPAQTPLQRQLGGHALAQNSDGNGSNWGRSGLNILDPSVMLLPMKPRG